jgi:hypothetical protein
MSAGLRGAIVRVSTLASVRTTIPGENLQARTTEQYISMNVIRGSTVIDSLQDHPR